MKKERKTLFELAPDKFVLPGRVEKPATSDLVFERDTTAPGVLYRANVSSADLGLAECDGYSNDYSVATAAEYTEGSKPHDLDCFPGDPGDSEIE